MAPGSVILGRQGRIRNIEKPVGRLTPQGIIDIRGGVSSISSIRYQPTFSSLISREGRKFGK